MRPKWHWSNQPNAEETKAKLSRIHKGRIPTNLESNHNYKNYRKLWAAAKKRRLEYPEEYHLSRIKASRWMLGSGNPRFGAKTSPMKGRKHTEEAKRKMSLALQGKIPWNKGIHQIQTTGENNPNWNGGSTLLREQARKSLEYKRWRLSVFQRDNFTCQNCKRSKEVRTRLEADHIKPWALFPKLRFELSNGRTLCNDCHRKTETYLNSNMKTILWD